MKFQPHVVPEVGAKEQQPKDDSFSPPSNQTDQMSIVEGLRGLYADVRHQPSFSKKCQRSLHLSWTACTEIVRITAAIPYAWRAARIHKQHSRKKLSSHYDDNNNSIDDDDVLLLPAVPYGSHKRQVADIWLPPRSLSESNEDANNEGGAGKNRPMCLFIHGGVWSSGEAWHYAPMARCLAQHGIITAVMTYRLFPETGAKGQAADVCAALAWCASQVAQTHKGDAENIALVGHSAGAHLCALALCAKAASLSNLVDDDSILKKASRVQPRRFVSLNGVFDIPSHYEYERRRGVESLSTMKRAMGDSHEAMAALSPSLILRGESKCADADSLSGRRTTRLFSRALNKDKKDKDKDKDTMAPSSIAARFPEETYFLTALGDTTVPFVESVQMHGALQEAGAPHSELLLYPAPNDHGSLVLAWPGGAKHRFGDDNDLAPWSRDLLDIIRHK
ncbi:hypothetical protein PPROV_001114900 [Pycnococcus provasolii]|uniref:protein-S-isoprenylcysteine alpha-carbonyl methylesterase n=1 Tax=Pycnococcus provasolii TaxID=41880 RepID=A0A830HYU9_9CHLO|nr:hypothetical protein PPROV_001114900 [Pycnococcus provasolii]